jgi:GMP synthase (glutamine-hydrolysing)
VRHSWQHPWVVLRHVEHEHLGTLSSVLDAQAIPRRYVDVFRREPVPAAIEGIDGLIVMGGPMGVYEQDKFPSIARELELIGRAAHARLPVIGICLGAQMIAAALGAQVFSSGQKEIGWYQVRSVRPQDRFTATSPEKFMGFHWHGDTFDLPNGATCLFESDLFPQQGFRWGSNVLALQFHFEVNRTMIAEWLEDPDCKAEMATVPDLSAAAILRDTEQHGAVLEKLSASYFTSILQQFTPRLAT